MSRESRLRRSYERSEYRALLDRRRLNFRIGHHDPLPQQALVELCGLRRHWIILTPCNPRSQRGSPYGNRRALVRLQSVLRIRRWRHWPALNRDPLGHWPDEPGVLLIDPPLRQVLGLGRRFRQNALVIGRRNHAPQLLWL